MSEAYKVAYNTWQEKTEWVQTDKRFDVLLPWGKHRADVLKEYIEHLESHIANMAVQLANAESKCRELVAENSGMNVFIEEECFVYSSDTPEPIDANDCKPKTPATDAFLAEVRASGADEVSAICRGLANKDGCSVNMRCSYNLTAERAEAVAAQLRKGAAL